MCKTVKDHGLWMRLLRTLMFAAVALAGTAGLHAQDNARHAAVLEVSGPIAPAMADYIVRGIDDAAADGAGIVILEMDTPGGLDSSMRDIINAILNAPVPVATYVSPSGARAASAGTYILYASHVAAMAPATHLGAATPVAIGGGGGGGDDGGLPFGLQTDGTDDNGAPTGDEDGTQPAVPDRSATESKAINDAAAYIRGLAELRGRNAQWAERAVREAATLTASEARDEGVIDFVAANVPELLNRADGMTVRLGDGQTTLATEGLAVRNITPDWRTAFLSVITNPNVALLLMLVGFYGLVLEFLNPGVLVPGTVGAISLILGLYSLALLPLNYAGAALILLGLALMVAEAFAPSFGVLGIGGTVAVVLGATIMFDSDVPGMELSLPLVAGVAVTGLALTLIVARMALRSFRARVTSGPEELVGASGHVLDWKDRQGHIWLHGERWQARSPQPIAPTSEEPVRVTGVEGLTLWIAPDDREHDTASRRNQTEDPDGNGNTH